MPDALENKDNNTFNPFTPKFKTYILPTSKREKCKWSSENW